MCLAGNEASMIETLNALNDARLQLVQWRNSEHATCGDPLLVSPEEGVDIFERRIATLEAKCRELGIHGPAPKADPGAQQRILASR